MTCRMIVVLALIVGFGTGAVIAQSDPIATRQELMKENDAGAKVVVAMMRNREPFDPAKVDKVFAQWADTAEQLPKLFPENSKTGDKVHASPKIWQQRADFDAKIVEFKKAVAGNREKAKSAAGLKAAVAAVGRSCDNCHEVYRLSRQ